MPTDPDSFLEPDAISPLLEMGAYEYLWGRYEGFPRLSTFLKGRLSGDLRTPAARISSQVERRAAMQAGRNALEKLHGSGICRFGVRVIGESEFPKSVLDAEHPSYCLYFQGFWNFMETSCISVVGTRRPSRDGLRRTKELVEGLVAAKHTVVSGLAVGIDTAAHKAALHFGGATVAVMGTPLEEQYPSGNRRLRERLAAEHLVITQFPVSAVTQRWFFLQRNEIMSALTKATIIVEAGKSSGTRTQARASIRQGRRLFILDSCLEHARRAGLTWLTKLETQGAAIRVRDCQDVEERLR